jgi:predicted ATPase
MNDRKESISTAHNKTLHWPLEPPRGEFPWDDLSKWLQFDSGIYWISGKAGSGKSTLMKHIYRQQKTRQLLSH